MESKSERFKRIAEARTNRVLEHLRLLSNCANKNNYSYTDNDIKKIFSAIDAELKTCKNKFINNNVEKFKL